MTPVCVACVIGPVMAPAERLPCCHTGMFVCCLEAVCVQHVDGDVNGNAHAIASGFANVVEGGVR